LELNLLFPTDFYEGAFEEGTVENQLLFGQCLTFLVFQKLGSMAVSSKQILSPSHPQQFILIGVWIWIYKKLYINSSYY